MRLKRLEMVGFKSFAEKTRVEFEPGITSVVGPNGCGKSNIADSIRWGLGEMSARSLRSQQMLDVIFNGTANRPPQGYCEVSLTFDNASHQLPLDFTEVSVSRRLFRSGESEYYINKTQCRLKDVRDLFLDTGIGNDGYYIMAQGKIEFILGAKPEERRELFEEAAGVSKYKVRREEALRKLNKVEQDMLRLNDSLAIYKQQMESLDAAVRKAKQHQKYQEELRTLEIATFFHQHQDLRHQWTTLNERQEINTRRVNELKEDLHQKESALTDDRAGYEALEQQVIELQQNAALAESEWAKTEAELNAARERETELKGVQPRLAAELTQLTAAIEERQKGFAALAVEVTDLRKQFRLKHDEFKKEDAKSQSNQNECLQLQKGMEAAKARLLELVRLLSHHRNETVRLTSLAVRHEEGSKAKQREFDKVRDRRASVEKQVEDQGRQTVATQERLAVVHNSLASLDLAQQDDSEKLSALEKNIQETRERLAGMDAEKASLERWLSQNPVALASATLRQQEFPGVAGPVGALFKTSAPYQKLLDRALGDRAEYFIANNLNDAQAAVRYLSDERKGWATFLVLDRLLTEESSQPFEAPGSRSLAEAVECDERFRPVLRSLLGKTFYVGATVFEESLLRGGADPEGLEHVSQATTSDLKRLAEDVTRLRQALSAQTDARGSLKDAMAVLETERAPLQAEAGKTQVLVQVQQESLNRLREDLELAQTEEKILHREKDDLIQAIDQTRNTLQQEEALLATLDGEQRSLQESVHTQDATLQELRQVSQGHQAVVSQLRLESETLRERLLGKEREEESLRREVVSIEQRLAQHRTDLDENAARLTQLAALQAEKGQALATLRGARDGYQTSLASLLEKRQQVQERLRLGEQTLAEARDILTTEQSRVQEIEFQVRTLEQDKARVEQALRDTYQLSVDEAREHHAEIQPNADEVARLRRRLEGLGPVNLAAPQEHAQLQERYDFLLTQQQDLLKAKDDLHQAIAKINATTREQFKTTFGQVREHFKFLFQTLFQGGEADLVLTDESNLLESGVDIVAQPPGKKLQNIALLSGGEKALIAIALLFAFFMVKPSPFCLLDEVDAPLDEANVGRFLQMVKTFAEKTQFIVITHNKRTMEMADILYGVTMAELGVSSLISVKLDSVRPEIVAA
ncbi:MAG: chromosome segregation protein SMC [Elusimicrobia bacterium RIFCSPLOWO2_01_FULL_59_12]|nr:MAG: chromosome segregation protein SMC [Elusimicrobia bacterium RIFCSPLOWO2_01_FULL_59_12]